MSRSAQRTQLAAAYILHHQPYRDTSRILEVFARDYGRLSVFARGVRGPKAKLAAVLQPFRLLLLSWSGRGEAPQLRAAESAGDAPQLPPACLLGCFYLNELMLKLTTRADPHPQLFDAYHAALESVRRGAALERTLRLFEKRLLEELGYGLDLECDGRGLDAGGCYQFRPGQGLAAVPPATPGALTGASLLSLAREELHDPQTLADARRLLAAALAHCLEGRELSTRAVARALVRRARHVASPEPNPVTAPDAPPTA
jgi:DNA repair protein RecO (recombination protein O)